jgi:methylglutaconyl-CoA hydratase
MSRTSFSLETDSRGIARLTLDCPERHNVLTGAICDGLTAACGAINADTTIRVVVLGGNGASFCAGGDLDWMRAQVAADGAGRRVEARRVADMLAALNTLDRPLIGRIHGPAYGGGVGLMAVCDATVVAEGAKFALTETRLGLIPATIAPYVIARMGEGPARSVFFSGRVFGAAEAQRLHLATRVVAAEDLDAAVEAEIAPYLATAPAAVAAAKRFARSLGPRIDASVIEASIDRLASAWETPEAAEGIAAFLEKRPASWMR